MHYLSGLYNLLFYFFPTIMFHIQPFYPLSWHSIFLHTNFSFLYMIAFCFVFVIAFFLILNVDLFLCSMYILIVFLVIFVL